jgi:hypothetical protein
MRHFLLAATATLLACTSPPAQGEDGESDTGEASLSNLLECEQPRPCGTVIAVDGDPGLEPPTAYEADEVCALENMRDGNPMLLDYSDGCEGMCYGSAILTRSDRSVLVQDYAEVFEGGIEFDGIVVEFDELADAQVCTLQPASYFEGCLAAFDVACLSKSNWYTDCAAAVEPSCEPGG